MEGNNAPSNYFDEKLLKRYWNTEKAVRSWIHGHKNYIRQFQYPSTVRYFLPPPPPPPPPPPVFISRITSRYWKKVKRRRRNNETAAVPALLAGDKEIVETDVVVREEQAARGRSMEEELDEPGTAEEEMDGEMNEPGTVDEDTTLNLPADLLAFMSQTIRHRIEREKQKAYEQEIENQTVIYVPADRPYGMSGFNEFGGDASAVVAMLLRKGGEETSKEDKRRTELITLYGTGAADRIQAEETVMQMKFDQEYHKHHPPFWPNIPLKL